MLGGEQLSGDPQSTTQAQGGGASPDWLGTDFPEVERLQKRRGCVPRPKSIVFDCGGKKEWSGPLDVLQSDVADASSAAPFGEVRTGLKRKFGSQGALSIMRLLLGLGHAECILNVSASLLAVFRGNTRVTHRQAARTQALAAANVDKKRGGERVQFLVVGLGAGRCRSGSIFESNYCRQLVGRQAARVEISAPAMALAYPVSRFHLVRCAVGRSWRVGRRGDKAVRIGLGRHCDVVVAPLGVGYLST